MPQVTASLSLLLYILATEKLFLEGAMQIGSARTSPTKAEEEVLSPDIADDALERAAAMAAERAITIAYCTYFYDCGWPLSRE